VNSAALRVRCLVPRSRPKPSAYVAAVARLGRRDQTAAELRRALARAGHEEADVEAALRRLRSQGYLDDDAFAQRYARSRMQHQGLGRIRVGHELRRKGLTRTQAETGVRVALADVSEPETIDALARRWWRQHATGRPDDVPERRMKRLWAFLVRRGFPPAAVQGRLRSLWPRWSEALEGLEAPEEP
jgi:regulatory protein